MKLLYKKARSDEKVFIPDALSLEITAPTLRKGLILQGEKRSIKLWIVRFLFQAATLGKAQIYCYRKNGQLVHTSYVIPKCYKFPFLGKHDYEIGPCTTHLDHRGKGYYPSMLKQICSTIGTETTVFYMIVDESNIASIKGIEKAGFERCGNIVVTGIMKRYRLE